MMTKKLLLNPFETISENRLFLSGFVFILLGSLLGYTFNGRFDGVIDLHFTTDVTFYQPLIDNLINSFSLFVVLFALGKYINQKTRSIDIITPILISRLPIYILTLTNINNYISQITEAITAKIIPGNLNASLNIDTFDLIQILLFSVVSISCLIYFVIILYNGFKTATNCKTPIHKLYFALGIISAEIISKVLITYITY